MEKEERLVKRRGIRFRRLIGLATLGFVMVCLVAVAVSWVSNLRLPTESSTIETLGDLEIARLEEAGNLRRTLGNQVWPGWGDLQVPVIVYNEAYAFLVGYPGEEPPVGWVMQPSQEPRGGEWEQVPGGQFNGRPYYRQPLADPEATPENFTVKVGDLWVATLQTKEYSFIQFVEGFGGELPPLVRDVFPYRLMWKPLAGDSEGYLAALVHETFHSFEGTQAYEHFAAAERVARLEGDYPWDEPDSEDAWQAELDILARAVEVQSEAEAREVGIQFLEQRDQRRQETGLSAELVEYENQREWLEGLAKYAELTITREASRQADYSAVPALQEDPEFHQYASRERFWRQQFSELKRMTQHEGEIRFYYTGMAQATLLDWIQPDWKAGAMQPGAFLDDLIRDATLGG